MSLLRTPKLRNSKQISVLSNLESREIKIASEAPELRMWQSPVLIYVKKKIFFPLAKKILNLPPGLASPFLLMDRKSTVIYLFSKKF